jgi:hypothetical protein
MIVPFLICRHQSLVVEREHFTGQLPECFQFVPPDVVPVALSETVDEKRLRAATKEYDAPKTSGFALSLPSQTLLDHAATQVSIDQPTFSLRNGLAKLFIGNPFTASEAGERFGFENAHPPAAMPSIMLSNIALSHTPCNLAWAQSRSWRGLIGPEPTIL